MRVFTKVRGTQSIQPLATEIGIDTVYIRQNIMYIDTQDFTGWEYDETQYNKDEYIALLANKEQVNTLENKLLTADEKYKALDKTTVSIDEIKLAKKEQLKYLCEQDILNGFTSTLNNHTYRTNRDDQTNFLGKYNQLMNDTTITTVMWKTEDVGYISHTRQDWLSIYYEALTNKETKLFRYDQLKQTVDSKTTNADVDAIIW